MTFQIIEINARGSSVIAIDNHGALWILKSDHAWEPHEIAPHDAETLASRTAFVHAPGEIFAETGAELSLAARNVAAQQSARWEEGSRSRRSTFLQLLSSASPAHPSLEQLLSRMDEAEAMEENAAHNPTDVEEPLQSAIRISTRSLSPSSAAVRLSTSSTVLVGTRVSRPADRKGWWWGTGRRKAAVARVRLRPKDGGLILIRRRDGTLKSVEEYFTELNDRADVVACLRVAQLESKIEAVVCLHGGGHMGQALATRLGIARALSNMDHTLHPLLRDLGFLTRDSREVERKKYGRAGARRRFQFSKR